MAFRCVMSEVMRVDGDNLGACALHRHHGEVKATKRNSLAFAPHSFQAMDDQAADGIHIIRRFDVAFQQAFQAIDWRAPG